MAKRRKGREIGLKKRAVKVCNAKCRDCGLEQHARRTDFFRASQPRCVACGGLIDTDATFTTRSVGYVRRVKSKPHKPHVKKRLDKQSKKGASDG